MAPNAEENTAACYNTQTNNDKGAINNKVYSWDIAWINLITLIYFHVAACYGLYLAATSAKLATVVFACVLHMVSVLGELGGAHRLWSHRSYKASLGLRIFLMLADSFAYEETIYSWARDHRLHHKYSETDADPYNRNRGFFFSHVGWLLIRKHPLVREKGKQLDLSDLHEDAVVMFQNKYQHLINPVMAFLLPLLLPVYLWSETWRCSWHVACVLRYVIHANGTWLINSAAHSFGYKPYDKHIHPTENSVVSFMTLGEGSHNFHHTFPWDYSAAEFGHFHFNFTSWFIGWCGRMGWAWDLKTADPSMVRRRIQRTGDGTHRRSVWGWGDKEMAQEDKSCAVQYFKENIS